jgi:diacylglycerol O-acyltransferase
MGRTAGPIGPIDRATADDLVSLATDVGAAPMQVGAVLRLDGGGLDPHQVAAAVEDRIRAVPRLRQRLVRTGWGGGRPVWVDDADFDLAGHLRTVACPAPGDEDALLAVAADIIGTPLPADEPLWRMALVTDLDGDRTALIVAFHHVLADGIGGLAVLANLVDGATAGPVVDFPRPPPSSRELVRDAVRGHLASLADLPASVRRLRAAFTQLRPAAGAHPAPCSLNRPTGSRRRFVVVRAPLDDVRRTAHAHGATVNDVVLAAVAASLRTLLLSRDETVDRFVVSVPVSARRETSATDLGNQTGAVPIEVPATGDPVTRLEAIAESTRAAKQTARAASTALLGPIFRLLARLGIFRWFIDRQRLVHTFVTNLRGPEAQLSFLGLPIVDILVVALITGNVTVSFAVLSYAGTLGITVIADPDRCPDLDALRDALQHELDQLTTSPPSP